MKLLILLTSLKNLLKNKSVLILNIGGLSMGLAISLLIFNYSYSEFQADTDQNKEDNTYIVIRNGSTYVPFELARVMREQIPGIKYVAMVETHPKDKFALRYGSNKAIKTDVIFADSIFPRIFNYGTIAGNYRDALSTPGSIILTESEAFRLFNREDPVGRILSLNGMNEFLGSCDVEVKAVIKDPPGNANMQFRSIVSTSTAIGVLSWMQDCIWTCCNVQDYIVLEKGTDPDIIARRMNRDLRPLIPEEVKCNFTLLSFSKVYFSDIWDNFKHGNRNLTATLNAIAFLILFIAIINYINLTIAGLARRNTEVGVMKVFGMLPRQVVGQLLTESVLVTFASMIGGLFLACLLRAPLNNISIVSLPALPLSSVHLWLFIVAGSILTGILAGILPALRFNRFRPVSLINGRSENADSGTKLRRFLVIVQFVISILLIIVTITVTSQLDFLNRADKGFDSSNIINVRLSPEVKKPVFRSKISMIPGVKAVSFSRGYPGNMNQNWGAKLIYQGNEGNVEFAAEVTDPEYIDMMGLKIILGRNFSDSLQSDMGNVIINEAAVKAFGLKNPLEAVLKDMKRVSRVMGVVKDFNFESLHSKIRPLVIYYEEDIPYGVNIRIAEGSFADVSATIKRIKDVWEEVSPDFPFDYRFIDDEVENHYRSEMIFSKIFRFGSLFAIIISCTGLFGLVLGTTEQKRREIGIRKVNGATAAEIMLMLNMDFIKWILLSFIIGSPAAFYFLHRWLSNFAYRIHIGAGIFVMAGLITLGTALLTVSFQTLVAARKNPVDSLRHV